MINLSALQDLLTATESLTDEQRREIYHRTSAAGALSPEDMEMLQMAANGQLQEWIAAFDETDTAEQALADEVLTERKALQPVADELGRQTLAGVHALAADHARALAAIQRGVDDEAAQLAHQQDQAAADVIRASLKTKDS